MKFDTTQGDIAAQSANVLVNAAGTSLRMGSGVAGALRRAGGPEINEDAMEQGPIDLGATAVTDAYNLHASIVVHAAAMPHYGDGRATEHSIRLATHNALKRADRGGYESVVIPALGCGAAGFDIQTGARLIVEEIDAFSPESIQDVRFIAYSDEEYDVITRAAKEGT